LSGAWTRLYLAEIQQSHPNAQDDCEGRDVAAYRNRRDFCDLFLDYRAHRDGRPYSRDRGHRLISHVRGPRVSMERLFLPRSSCRMPRDSCSSHHWALYTDHRSGHAGVVNSFLRPARRNDWQDTSVTASQGASKAHLNLRHVRYQGHSGPSVWQAQTLWPTGTDGKGSPTNRDSKLGRLLRARRPIWRHPLTGSPCCKAIPHGDDPRHRLASCKQ